MNDINTICLGKSVVENEYTGICACLNGPTKTTYL